MKRVTGIGGIFFNANDPVALRAWYKQHLGIDVQEWGGTAFTWTDAAGNPTKGTTVDRKSTRLNSSHVRISYAVFCLKKKKLLTVFANALEWFSCEFRPWKIFPDHSSRGGHELG